MMKNETDYKTNQPSLKGLLPLAMFLFIYFAAGIIYKDFSKVPLLIAMMTSFLIMILLSVKSKGQDHVIKTFCKGAGNPTIMMMVVIYMMSGAFSAVTTGIHGADLIAETGMSLLPENLLLPGIFLIGFLLSFSMGSSMGAASALMPVAMSIVKHSDLSVMLACGTVVGGVIAGDNLSFISDTSIAASAVTGTSVKNKFKESLMMALSPAIITIFLLSAIPVQCHLNTSSSVPFINMVPFLAVIILSLLGMGVIEVLATGILICGIIGMAENIFTFSAFLALILQGIMNLAEMSLIAVAAGGLIALTEDEGGIKWICLKLSQAAHNQRFAAFFIALATTLLDIATANNTMAIITCGPIAEDISNKYNISKRKSASIMGYFSTITNGIVPYAGHLMEVSGIAGITPVSIIPYVWYDLLAFIFGLIWIFTEPDKHIAFLRNKED